MDIAVRSEGSDEAQSRPEVGLSATMKQVADSLPSTQSPVLLCFSTGDRLPMHCEPMPRDPSPALGGDFDENFSSELMSALQTNPAIHDGAVMLHRRHVGAAYRIHGWSYRLRAPLPKGSKCRINRGSAYNSCLATSAVSGVDVVYLISGGMMTCFASGEEVLCD